MSQHVVWYDSTETGAPTLNNVAGSLIEVVKACAVTGFNTKAVTSITVAAGVATAQCAAHGFSGTYGKDVQIDGCAEAALNGRKALTATASGTFSFLAPGVADGSYGGSISAKRAPLGWVEAYSGTNRSVFRRADVQASAQMLRLEDTAASATDARAVMIEAATDVDAYSAPAPTAAQLAGGQYWYKGANSAAAKKWVLVGDGRFFWLFVENSNALGGFKYTAFGDAVSYKSGDAYPGLLMGDVSVNATGSGGVLLNTQGLGVLPSSYGLVVARISAQTGGAVRGALINRGSAHPGTAGGSAPGLEMVVDRHPFFSEENAAYSHPVRGELPGLAWPMAQRPFAALQLVDTLGDGRTYLAVPLLGPNNGQMLIDLTGPWR